ncbi:hypothetical protein GETHLI_26230 [Geothrix limicola]|uniref:Uncharacterized protein n=1 Tax=Geothrix limicola TaxID=2927978 RepID=A0ABQ5QI83_9BACT|nr:hypothetical protein [Geothrix limicola]GLH74121.1 hypothetical protein GETHLI_26230 [Geothrix limicola]
MFDRSKSKGWYIRRGIGFAFLGALAVALFGFVVMSLWNWLLPALFGAKAITYWQALGLLVLSRILLGGFHRHHRSGFHHRRHMFERWERMTPEERERFRQGFRGRHCGHREAEGN